MDRFDPTSAAFAADPYTAYAELRRQGSPHYFEPMDLWLVARHADVTRLATDPLLVRSLDGLVPREIALERQRTENFHDMPFHERFVQTSLLDSDGEPHRRMRRQVFGAFRADRLERLRSQIATKVAQLLRGATGRFDFVERIAAPVPGHVIGALLGIPEADRPKLRVWSEEVVRYFDVDRTLAKKAAAERATREFHDYLALVISERRAAPRGDLLSEMIVGEAAGGFVGDELISTAMLILMAGHGSTIDVLGSGLHLLLQHPNAMKQIKDRPEALPNAIEEIFRFEPPLPFFHRHATVPVDVGGVRFPAGTTFGLLYASANRDERAFVDAAQFNIERQPNRHLAFGMGPHLCLGNALAKLTMSVVFEALTKVDIRLVDEPVRYKRGLSVRGPERLLVEIA